jgi:AAA family ATP:ADP antiporter
MTNAHTDPSFSRLRAIFWPIKNYELKKFLPMALMKGFILFNWAVLRATKDALIITAGESGVEVISFIKTWGVVPVAFLFLFVYARLSNVLKRQQLFYATIAPFLIFYILFALFLFPNGDFLHPSVESIQALKSSHPHLQWLFPIYGYWTYVIFYIFSELWQSVVLALLFWQLANEINTVKEAKRFYALFGVISGCFVAAGGYFLKFVNQYCQTADGSININILLTGVIMAGLAVVAIYAWMNKYVFKDLPCYKPVKNAKPRERMSLRRSFRYILSSKYLGYIALMILAYGLSINLIEMTWKHKMRLVYPTSSEYGAAMGGVLMWIGTLSGIFMMIGVNIIRIFSWLTSALITPIIFVITGSIFFSFIIFEEQMMGLMGPFLLAMGWTPIMLSIQVGAFQNVFSKSAKYALFDPTKEMSYIPLDNELKTKGKAAVDVVGERCGKASGALIQQGLLVLTGGTQMTIAPYLAGIVALCLGLWFVAVFGLNRSFSALLKEKYNQKY